MKRFRKGFLALALALILIGGSLATVAWFMGAETSLEGGWGRGGFGVSNAREINLTFSDAFDHIDLNLGAANVTVQEGSAFRATGRLPYRVNIFTSDNRLIIEEAHRGGFSLNFGFRRQNYHITITVPPGTVLDTLSLDSGAGRLDVQNIEAQRAYITSGAGTVNLRNVDFGHTVLHTGAGNVDAGGNFTGTIDVSTGAGNVSITLPGAREDYAYTIQTGAGRTTIDGSRITGGATRSHTDPVATLRVSTGAGNASVNFRG